MEFLVFCLLFSSTLKMKYLRKTAKFSLVSAFFFLRYLLYKLYCKPYLNYKEYGLSNVQNLAQTQGLRELDWAQNRKIGT